MLMKSPRAATGHASAGTAPWARVVSPPERSADPVEDPDPARAANAAAVGNLLRCWVREQSVPEPADGVLRLELKVAGVRVEAPVYYWSEVGWHRFGQVRMIRRTENGKRVDRAGVVVEASSLALLLGREVAASSSIGGDADADVHRAAQSDLVAQVSDSVAHTARFIAARRVARCDPAGTTPFLSGEQAQILGRALHPVPKSRGPLTETESAAYCAELRGAFQLHWFAAARSIVSSDSALPRSAEATVSTLTGPGLIVPAGMVAIPAHPWQARDLVTRPAIAELLDEGSLRDLGPAGPRWHPTSSSGTVYRAEAPVMLKLSLGPRLAGSRRENLRKELLRGLEAHRMLEAGLGAELSAAHPGFGILRDPAWLAVDLPDSDPNDTGEPDSGLDAVLRTNPFGPSDLVRCIAGLIAEQPGAGVSLLASLCTGLAIRSHRRIDDVAREWFARYLEVVVAPMLWLYAEHGVALEAHQRNTLVALNAGGWPIGGRYRGDQGFHYAESRVGELARWVPEPGVASDSIVPDDVIDERLGFDLGIDNILGLVGALGAQGLADERLLLDDLRRFLTWFAEDRTAAGSRVPEPVTRLLDCDTLRCEANLLTRVATLDEPPGQLVRVDIPNPLAKGAA